MAAESNHMLLDVKLDLKDGKCELYYLKVRMHTILIIPFEWF